jgi:hypothetical protein
MMRIMLFRLSSTQIRVAKPYSSGARSQCMRFLFAVLFFAIGASAHAGNLTPLEARKI